MNTAKLAEMLSYLKLTIEGEDSARPYLGDIEKLLSAIVEESTRLGIEPPITVNLRKNNPTRSSGNIVFAANELQTGTVGFGVRMERLSPTSTRSGFRITWSEPNDCIGVKRSLLNRIELAIRFLELRNEPKGATEVIATPEAIEALFKELWPVAKKVERRNRKDKGIAVKDGTGFEEFGFYSAQTSWCVYEKTGIAHNAPIDWRTLTASQAKKVDALFPTKIKGKRRNAT